MAEYYHGQCAHCFMGGFFVSRWIPTLNPTAPNEITLKNERKKKEKKEEQMGGKLFCFIFHPIAPSKTLILVVLRILTELHVFTNFFFALATGRRDRNTCLLRCNVTNIIKASLSRFDENKTFVPLVPFFFLTFLSYLHTP